MTIKFLKEYFENTTNPKFFLVDVFSWRGNYGEVAFEPSKTGTREESLALIERALTETFTGYKGGEYDYNEWTDVHFEFDYSRWDDDALYKVLLSGD